MNLFFSLDILYNSIPSRGNLIKEVIVQIPHGLQYWEWTYLDQESVLIRMRVAFLFQFCPTGQGVNLQDAAHTSAP